MHSVHQDEGQKRPLDALRSPLRIARSIRSDGRERRWELWHTSVMRRFRLCMSLLLLSLPTAAFAETGKVVGVIDGDTITVLVDKRQVRVRLAEIDAPERGQPYSTRSKQALSDKVFGKSVGIEATDTDRYGRSVAMLFVLFGVGRVMADIGLMLKGSGATIQACTEGAISADFVIAFTRENSHEKASGRVLFEVTRLGVPLSVVKDRRHPR